MLRKRGGAGLRGSGALPGEAVQCLLPLWRTRLTTRVITVSGIT